MKRDEALGSKNFKSDDLLQGDFTLLIDEVTQEGFKQEDGYMAKKLVLTFRGTDKRFISNTTNSNIMFDMLGDDTDDWVGQRITLHLGKTNYQGKRVNCIEVKEAPAKKATAGKAAGKPAPEAEADDNEPPF